MTSRWRLNLGADEQKGRRELPDPVGYSSASHQQEEATGKNKKGEVDAALKNKKLWDVAASPFKNVGMMAFMMWMSGNTVQIFSIGITFTGLVQPLKAILSSGAVFSRFSDKSSEVLLPRLLFCVINLGGFFFSLYKLSKLGLLPTNASDWAPSEVPQVTEFSAGGSLL